MALSDLGNAERLVAAYGKDLRYVAATKQWLVWDDRRFTADTTGEIKRCAKKAMRAILFEAAVQDNDEHYKQLIAHQIRSESERAIRASIALAESDPMVAVPPSVFDNYPMLFNVQNGTLDLLTGTLHDHDRNDRLTKLAPVTFDLAADSPTWSRFLNEIMDGEAERIAFLQRAVGYSLTGDVSEHALFLLHGVGANGKSTFIETLRFVLGDYSAQADFSTFLASKNTAIRNDIARLTGVRLVCATESDAGRRFAENIVKHLTGGDTVAARFLYSEHFEFRPQFKLWLATNHKPRVVGTDGAIWRRIKLIPFTVTIPVEKRDRTLLEKLKSEANGILNWAIAGLRDWQAQGLNEPRSISGATEAYRQQEDTIGNFLDAKVRATPDGEVRASDLYALYRQWAESTGEFHLSDREFSAALVDRGFHRKRIGSRIGKPAGWYWKGILCSS